MRKLGKKNIKLLSLFVIIVIFVVVLFIFFINRINSINKEVYNIDQNSIIYDMDYNYINMESDGELKQSFDGNYYISFTKDGSITKYNVGSTVVVYNKNNNNVAIYGVAYLVNEDGSVSKSTKMEEITRLKAPKFYKLGDRKYLFIDKDLDSNDSSISTTNYLIIELDKQGNATLANQEINLKTINPMIIKGTKYEFDIVHEQLIINDNKIDLKNVIGSSNEYQDKEKTDDKTDDKTNENGTDNYYDDYLKKLVNSFNNLHNSVGNVNEANKNDSSTNNTYLDLTRWLTLSSVTSTVNSIILDYTVFDPNNEYAQVFITIKPSNESEEAKKYYLSKEQTSYVIRGLDYDNEYTISFGYVLALSVDSSQNEIINNTIKMKTKIPAIKFEITKITATKIYYKIKLDENYEIDSGIVSLYSDNILMSSVQYNASMNKSNEFSGSFDYTSLGYLVELRFENIIYNGDFVNLRYSSKYIN